MPAATRPPAPAVRPAAAPRPGTTLRLAAAGLLLTSGAAFAQAPARAQPAAKPSPHAMRVETLSPALEATLQAWYAATKDVEKLEGRHVQVASDNTFQSEKHSVGKFYYQAPDRGRIDLQPRPKSQCAARNRGKQAPYAVEAGDPRTWVCDGENLLDVDVAKREVNVTPLPPQHRGAGIMNGPLPFLLGMPPAMVKRRFRVRFPSPAFAPKGDVRAWLADPGTNVTLAVQPLLRQDSENWTSAVVVLSKPDFLPVRVRLYLPGGAGDTTYEFSDLQKNKSGFITVFTGDPFKPNLRGYQVVTRAIGGGAPANDPGAEGGPAPAANPAVAAGQAPQTVPAVIGMPTAWAVNVLTASGYQPKKYPGSPTENRALVGKVEAQQYEHGTELPAGKVVGLKIWVAGPTLRQASAEQPAPR